MQKIPSLDALDPFGGFVILSIVLAHFFCGWFCDFGALQAVFGSLEKKLFGRHFAVPVKRDKILRWIKLIGTVIFEGNVILRWGV